MKGSPTTRKETLCSFTFESISLSKLDSIISRYVNIICFLYKDSNFDLTTERIVVFHIYNLKILYILIHISYVLLIILNLLGKGPFFFMNIFFIFLIIHLF